MRKKPAARQASPVIAVSVLAALAVRLLGGCGGDESAGTPQEADSPSSFRLPSFSGKVPSESDREEALRVIVRQEEEKLRRLPRSGEPKLQVPNAKSAAGEKKQPLGPHKEPEKQKTTTGSLPPQVPAGEKKKAALDSHAGAPATEGAQSEPLPHKGGVLIPAALPASSAAPAVVPPPTEVPQVQREPKVAGGEKVLPQDPADPRCLRPECHSDVAAKARIHGPLGAGLCDPCHRLQGPQHHFVLARAGSDLCTFCHLSVAYKKFVHEPVKKNPCTSCHDPHSSGSKFLLKYDKEAQLCASCHTLKAAEHVHGPLGVGQCSVCHEPHQSDQKGLVRLPGPQLCYECHNDTEKDILTKKYVHKPVTENCAQCHDPHYGTNKSFLRKKTDQLCLDCHKDVRHMLTDRPVVHGALAQLDRCANCHAPHVSELPHLLKDLPIRLCLRCHDKPIEATDGRRLKDVGAVLAESRFKHGPIREGDCTACHNAHASINYRLLAKYFPKQFYTGFDVKNFALCFSCHQKSLVLDEKTSTLTGFRDGYRNLHYVHVNKKVKGRTCRACHEVHASNLPKHIRKGVPFGPSGWVLPINFEKTENGGRCTSACHKPLAYDRTKDGAPP